MGKAYQLFSEPFAYPFMQRAIFVAIVTGVICAVLSCYLILHGWSLMGDAISHAMLPGMVIAFVLGIPLVIGALFSGMFFVIAAGYLKENSRLKEDTIIGILFSGMFALGLMLFSRIETNQHLNHILFGDVLGITDGELNQILFIAFSTLVIILLKHKDFMLYCFDRQYAQVLALPVKTLHYGLLCLLALTIVVSLRTVGVILVVAMLISPGITAFMLCRSFYQMLVIAVLISIFSCILGTLISFHIDGATGPCIVIVQSTLFLIAFLFKKCCQKYRNLHG